MSPLDRERLNLLAASTEDLFDDEIEHFEQCPECGQSFDMRRLGDVMHHNRDDHAPLAVH